MSNKNEEESGVVGRVVGCSSSFQQMTTTVATAAAQPKS